MSPKIDASAKIDATAIIGDDVEIGAGTTVGAYSVIEGRVTIGSLNHISHHVVIGAHPQDLKYRDEATEVVIGTGNVIREFSTIHRGTIHGGGSTIIGDRNYLMAYSHVGHDCKLADDIIMSNSVQLAGHVEVFRFAHFGGLAGIHQYVRIGESAFVGAGAMVRFDVPHYAMARGDRAFLVDINEVGLHRRGFPENRIEQISDILRTIGTDGDTSSFRNDPDFMKLQDFYQSSKEGVLQFKGRDHEQFLM